MQIGRQGIRGLEGDGDALPILLTFGHGQGYSKLLD